MARRGYPPEFRRRVVELVEGGRKVSELAAEFEVSVLEADPRRTLPGRRHRPGCGVEAARRVLGRLGAAAVAIAGGPARGANSPGRATSLARGGEQVARRSPGAGGGAYPSDSSSRIFK